MRVEHLPSPGQLRQSYDLRVLAASSISYIETVANLTPGGKIDTAGSLHDFFIACAEACKPMILAPGACRPNPEG